ncbi:site-specific DNA-methyltransferase [Fibrobacter sp. UWB13]|uniref:site-specific DNA-methyltransferase n=1 Tax=Fibrobacter sp. UWB13 TaxID=1896204 RepID=UPI000A0BAED3|nr:site-specific DNA-methyltransferase [Fibrobacter sp. UWB13]SMG12401.1 adenine-specific DNA-methyltransferase [Fibrobacter sp. UWB13]
MEKANMHSLDMVNENIKKIGNLFPECVTETVDENGNVKAAIDFEKLQENLSHATIGEGEERYQFTWPGKREAIHNANAPTNMTLRPCKEESVDFDNTENLYIEGDNLEVLKLLQENYLGKVKMIYIDPPYNTGNDFVYNDDFKEDTESFQSKSGMYDEDGNMLLQNFEKNTESNGRFHTDWLNMMYPRLKIARNLLSDDGVIFISIDDNEVENLRKVCDEIYGEGNFIACISWRRTDNQPNIGFFARVKEYILIYAKTSNFSLGRLPLTEKAKAEYRYKDAKGLFRRSILLHKTRGRRFYPKVTKLGNTLNGPWMVSEEEFDRMDANDEIYWTENGDGQPYGKIYLSESKGQIANDFWGIEYGTNQRASLEVEKIFNKRFFDFPKPISLLSFLVTLGSNKNSIILDFFSGSATTAHAVMQLNAEDGGKRKFICVQLPEATVEDSEAYKAGYKNICEIGKERIRRAGNKIKEEFGEKAKDLDIGFRVLKLADSNMKDVYYSPAETDSADIFDVNNVKEDRTPLDLLFQVMPECNLPLFSKIEERSIEGKTVYFVNGNYLVACFDEGITEKLIKSVIDVPDSEKPYYFYMRNLGLESDKVLDNFEQLFVHYSPTTKRKVI